MLGYESSGFVKAGEIVAYMIFVRTLLYEVSVWSLRLDYFRPLLLESFPVSEVLQTVVCSRKQFKREFVNIMQSHRFYRSLFPFFLIGALISEIIKL